MIRLFTYVLVFLLGLSQTAVAQEQEAGAEAGGFLVELLQDNLSGENRNIRVTGLDGAFSSKATIEKIEVSDDDGVWMTVSGAELDWNRLALLRGNFVVNTLRADSIVIDRKPGPTKQDETLPSPEAQGFQLPELPVSVNIGEIAVDRLKLDPSLTGIGAEMSVLGNLLLDAGKLDSRLAISRLDRPTDLLDLKGQFANDTGQITLDLILTEAENGLLSEVLNIPERPAIKFTAQGQGTVSDFETDISLATDATERLTGQVFLKQPDQPAQPDIKPDTVFGANLSGDLRPLMAERFRDFFGPAAQLELAGLATGDGALGIDRFALATEALSLTGALNIAASGGLDQVTLTGTIGHDDRHPVVLPISGVTTTIRSADIAAEFDATVSSLWQADVLITGVDRPDLKIAQANLSALGELIQTDGTELTGDVTANLNGVDFADQSLREAVGEILDLRGEFAWSSDQSLKLNGFRFQGADYMAHVDADISGLDSGLEIDGTARIDAQDMSRFSALAGRPLAGAISGSLSGTGSPLGGMFDIRAAVRTADLAVGIAQLDALTMGETDISLDAARDATGTTLRDFQLRNAALDLSADGVLRSSGSSLSLAAALDDLGRVVPQIPGPVALDATLRQTAGSDVLVTANVAGPENSTLKTNATITSDQRVNLDFDGVVTFLDRFVPQLTGNVAVVGTAERSAGAKWSIETRTEGSAGLSGTIDATYDETDGSAEVTFDAALDRIERFISEIAGRLQARGQAQKAGTLWTVAADANGPGGISANLSGTFDQQTNRADMSARGQAQLGLANTVVRPNSVSGLGRFDLALRGAPQLGNVSGTLTTADAVLALPDLAQTIQDIDATIALAGGQAQITATGAPRAGGRFRASGPVALGAPYTASLDVVLNGIVLTDNISYTSSADGQLRFRGPLGGGGTLSGQIDFGETEINIATVSGAIGAAPIPNITHVGEPTAVRATRARANLLEVGGNGAGPVIGLNLVLSAPRRVFARGRGLNAELGGNILVRGTTARVVPSGQISLIRGTFDILGRRLKLDEGRVSLQGKLEPFLQFLATTPTSEGQATLSISGPMNAPVIEVFSTPERPSEEALAMLLFGDKFTELSPIKIAQLAAQLATLGGSGGGVTGKAREGLGVDVLDIGTDVEGNPQVGVGSYLSENVYTDITVNSQGQSEINLNLDVSKNLTLKGSVDNVGETGVGLFYQRDY
ncbi:translocation/assembly module TamB domain-containing protein [Arenibacterium sp. CAU 1754]